MSVTQIYICWVSIASYNNTFMYNYNNYSISITVISIASYTEKYEWLARLNLVRDRVINGPTFFVNVFDLQIQE